MRISEGTSNATCIIMNTINRYRIDLEQWDVLQGVVRVDVRQVTFLWLGNNMLFVYGTMEANNV